MKRIYLILCAVALMASCTNAQTTDTQAAAPQTQEAAAATHVKVINMDEFAQLISDYTTGEWKMKGQRPAVVDFNATWCGPCRKLAPILEELAVMYAGEIDFYSIDVDQNKPLAKAFNVTSIPMLLMCPTQGEPQRVVGLYPKEDLIEAFDYALLGKRE